MSRSTMSPRGASTLASLGYAGSQSRWRWHAAGAALLTALGCGGRAGERDRSAGSSAADLPPTSSSTPGPTPSSSAASPPRLPSANAPAPDRVDSAPDLSAVGTVNAHSCDAVAEMWLIRPISLGPDVLAANCGECHGAQLASPAGGVGPINDLQLLSAQGQLFFCDPERSPIVKSIRSGAMPPPASGYPPVSPLDLEAVLCTLAIECELSQADAGADRSATGPDAAVPNAAVPDGG